MSNITLQRGDYVYTTELYSAKVQGEVCAAFTNAGAEDPFAIRSNETVVNTVGWSKRSGTLMHNLSSNSKDRRLTVDEVLNATNAKPVEESQLEGIPSVGG